MKLYFASRERLCGLTAVVCARVFSTLPIAAVLLLLLSLVLLLQEQLLVI